jgi:hypothetical protein
MIAFLRTEPSYPPNRIVRDGGIVRPAQGLEPYYSDIGRLSVDPELMIRMLMLRHPLLSAGSTRAAARPRGRVSCVRVVPAVSR